MARPRVFVRVVVARARVAEAGESAPLAAHLDERLVGRRRRVDASHLDLTPAQRTEIGEAWLAAAGFESASITSFLRAAEELECVGAPAWLVAATRGASDEYLIKSDKTDHVAVHKGSALRRLQSATRT